MDSEANAPAPRRNDAQTSALGQSFCTIENSVIETISLGTATDDESDVRSIVPCIPASPIHEKFRREVTTRERSTAGSLSVEQNAASFHTTDAPPASRVLSAVSVIVPCFNEEGCIAGTIREIERTLHGTDRPFEIIIVDDGSTDSTGEILAARTEETHLRIIRHSRNRGYGFSLKHGIQQGKHDLIAIIDADGTYPIARLADLLDGMTHADMVVGARVGAKVHIPWIRRPAKWALRRLACYLAECDIPDLNSGMRVMRRDVVRRFLGLLPDGFSFTTTITLAMLTHGYEVRYEPIDYARRVGRSSIRPVRDTLNFFSLIVRTVLCFKPLRVFAPASATLFLFAVALAVTSKVVFGQLADVTAVTLAMGAIQMMGIGLVADLIDRRLSVRDPALPRETDTW